MTGHLVRRAAVRRPHQVLHRRLVGPPCSPGSGGSSLNSAANLTWDVVDRQPLALSPGDVPRGTSRASDRAGRGPMTSVLAGDGILLPETWRHVLMTREELSWLNDGEGWGAASGRSSPPRRRGRPSGERHRQTSSSLSEAQPRLTTRRRPTSQGPPRAAPATVTRPLLWTRGGRRLELSGRAPRHRCALFRRLPVVTRASLLCPQGPSQPLP